MKIKCFISLLLATILLCLCACGEKKPADKSTTAHSTNSSTNSTEISTQASEASLTTTQGKTTKQAGQWTVSLEKINLTLAKNKKYEAGQWLWDLEQKLNTAKWPYSRGDLVWSEGKTEDGKRTETLPWTEQKELKCIQYTDSSYDIHSELYVCDKASGKMDLIATGFIAQSVYGTRAGVETIYDDSCLLYALYGVDGKETQYFFYDIRTGKSTLACVDTSLRGIGGKRYMWAQGNAVYITDFNQLEAGNKDGISMVKKWDAYDAAYVKHCTKDGRYAYISLQKNNTADCAVIETATGKQVAFTNHPAEVIYDVFIDDYTEYVYEDVSKLLYIYKYTP